MTSLSRRDFIKLAGVVSAGLTLASCTPAARLLDEGSAGLPSEAGYSLYPMLLRLTYGPRLTELDRAARIGLEAWIEEQLHPAQITDPGAALRTRKYDRLDLAANELDGYDPREMVGELKTATLLRQVYSARQLQELMVDFWNDHFNITVHKNKFTWALKIVDDREVIRPHALGNFRELLSASAHSPAMLVYLDNQANLKGLPNENYAREVMELHTLGVDGGYSQQDVMELARCLTGWTVKKRFYKGEFTFKPELHDDGTKTVLGQTIAPAGVEEVELILETLALHPSTARHISAKLVQRFICDDPVANAPELVEAAAQTFLETGGEIKAVLRLILHEGLIRKPILMQPKFRRPVTFIASMLRMLEAETAGEQEIWRRFNQMGQPTFEWPTPDGPPDHSAAWSNNLMPRWKFSYDLARGAFEDTAIDIPALAAGHQSPEDLLDSLCLRMLGQPYPADGREEFLKALNPGLESEDLTRLVIAGIAASPVYQWY